MNYDFELEKVVKLINKDKPKLVCIQLPDGLKPLAGKIQDEIERKTKCNLVIYAGSCWGGCDIPIHVKNIGVDLLVQFGHAVFIRPW
jgi:diphthamide biosynthesis enzyme Dph1/Dph2-like protein